MLLRVVDYQYTADGLAEKDEQGRHKRNGGSFLCRAKNDPHPRFYFPGETFELDDAQAERELRVAGHNTGGRRAIIEPLSKHLEREQRAKERQDAQTADRDAYFRKMQELQAQTAQAQKLESLRLEKERERLKESPAPAPPQLPRELLDRLDRLEHKTNEQAVSLSMAEAQRAETSRQMAELEQKLAAERALREQAEQALVAKSAEPERAGPIGIGVGSAGPSGSVTHRGRNRG